jgi:hypothetical protein
MTQGDSHGRKQEVPGPRHFVKLFVKLDTGRPGSGAAEGEAAAGDG